MEGGNIFGFVMGWCGGVVSGRCGIETVHGNAWVLILGPWTWEEVRYVAGLLYSVVLR